MWSVLDGYSLQVQAWDKALSSRLLATAIQVQSPAEASLVTDLTCTETGGVRITGYLFSVDAMSPSLSGEMVKAEHFDLEMSGWGEIKNRSSKSVDFHLAEFCSAPANENVFFCEEAKRAIGE